MVAWMYRDEPRIIPIPLGETVEETKEVDAYVSSHCASPHDKFLRVGFDSLPLQVSRNAVGPLSADMRFYSQLKIPYSVRFDWCFWKRDLAEEERVYKKLTPGGQDYIFVHDTSSQGQFPLIGIPTHHFIVKNDLTENLFNLGKVLEKATQIHVIESSVRCLLEFFRPQLLKNKVQLFLYRQGADPFYNVALDEWNGTSLPWTLRECVS